MVCAVADVFTSHLHFSDVLILSYLLQSVLVNIPDLIHWEEEIVAESSHILSTSIWCNIPFQQMLNFNVTFLFNPPPAYSISLRLIFIPSRSHPLCVVASSASGSALPVRCRGDGAAGDGGRRRHQEGRDSPRSAGNYPLQGPGPQGWTPAQVHRQCESSVNDSSINS